MEMASYTLHTTGRVTITITAPRNSIIVEARLVYDKFPADYWACTRP
jgi:hypothetical protein